MAISNVGLAPQAQPTQQRAAEDAAAATQVDRAGGRALPQDRVEISDAAQSDGGSSKADTDSAQEADQPPRAPIRRQTLYPGQRGYVPPPLLSQFDSSGRALANGSKVDIRA